MIRSALAAGGKPHLRATRFLTGGSPRLGLGLNLSTMIGAAGPAWGPYEHFQDRNPSVMTTIEGGGFAPSGSPPPTPPPPLPTRPPPLPIETSAAAQPGPDALRRLVALTIAAARIDGELGEEEYGRILAAAREHG